MLIVNQKMDVAMYFGEGTTLFTNEDGGKYFVCVGNESNKRSKKRVMTGTSMGKFPTEAEANRVFREILDAYRSGERLYVIPISMP